MRKLGWATVAVTYFLMVWGNLVSSTGSGLACPDWPTCHGTVTPAFSIPVMFEWGHRLLAFTATCFILLTVYKVLRAPSPPGSALKRSGKSLLGLLGLQILLGGTTVLLGLSPAVSTIHLVIANLVLGGLITVACVITWGNPVVKQPSAKLKRMALVGLGGMLVQLALGALVRHTHSGLACPFFPNCLEGFLPEPLTLSTFLAFAHRWWGILLAGHFLGIALVAARESLELARPARSLFGLSVAQVLLGIGTVLGGLRTDARATHAAIGYALWGLLFYITLRSGGVRALWEKRA